MYPVIFKLGPLEIKSWGVMLAVSFLIGYLIAQPKAQKNGIEQSVLLDLCFYILLSSIIGSRAFYVVTHWEQYGANPLTVFSIWEGGLSMMGGVLLSLLVSYLYLKKKEVRFTLMADILAPSMALWVAITRIGCFLYGCCYGLPTDLPWGIQFPGYSAAGSHFHELIHPAQLYASAYGLLIFLALLAIEKRNPPTGVLFGTLMVMYATARFFVDFIRYYEPEQYLIRNPVELTNNQVICIFLFIFGIVLIALSYKKKSRGGTNRWPAA